MTESVAVGAESLTQFVAYSVLFLACAATLFYAVANDRYGTLGVEIWRYVELSMVAGMGYAVAGTIEVFDVAVAGGTTVTAVRQVFQLVVIVLLSLAMRELYYRLPYRSDADAPISLATARTIEAAFLAIVIVEFAVVISIGLVDAVQLVQSLGSVAFAAYGISFAVSVRAETMSSGTVIDTLLLQFIAVLICLGAVGLLEGGTLIGVPAVIVESTASVFTVMSATFLITLAIRLKQSADAMAG